MEIIKQRGMYMLFKATEEEVAYIGWYVKTLITTTACKEMVVLNKVLHFTGVRNLQDTYIANIERKMIYKLVDNRRIQ